MNADAFRFEAIRMITAASREEEGLWLVATWKLHAQDRKRSLRTVAVKTTVQHVWCGSYRGDVGALAIKLTSTL